MPKLNVLRVKTAKPGRHGDGGGLFLVVTPSGSRSWVLRVVVARVQAGGRVKGQRRDIGLGSAGEVSLAEAREKAAVLRKVAHAGGDPIAERDRGLAAIPTFREAAEACHAARKAGWTVRTANAFLATLKLHVFPSIGNQRVDAIDERDIVAVLSPVWTSKPSAGRKLRQRISIVLDFAKGHGWRTTGAPREGLRPLLSKQARAGNFASMPYAEVPGFVAELCIQSQTMGRLALLFVILTAARSGEVRSARWSHVDLERFNWTRPAELMKSDDEHVVTLSPPAISLLRLAAARRMTNADCLIFPGSGGRPLSDMTLSKVLRDGGYAATVHGFRSSFRTWAAEQMPTVPDAVAEAALAHVVPDAVVRAYQRAKFMDLRRSLLTAWGNFCQDQSSIARLVG